MTHVPCDDVALKIADALWPDDGIDDEAWSFNHGLCWGETESEIKQAVKSGMLPVKKPLTLAPLTFLNGNAWKSGVVDIDDLQAYVADRRITVVVGEPPEQADTQPQAGNDAPEGQAPESKEQRQGRRLKACEDAGLVMPASSSGRLPDGVGRMADREGVKRQSFSADVKAALRRREAITKPGRVVRHT